MGSLQQGTASLGPTIVQMLPLLFAFLVDAPIAMSFGNTQG